MKKRGLSSVKYVVKALTQNVNSGAILMRFMTKQNHIDVVYAIQNIQEKINLKDTSEKSIRFAQFVGNVLFMKPT